MILDVGCCEIGLDVQLSLDVGCCEIGLDDLVCIVKEKVESQIPSRRDLF